MHRTRHILPIPRTCIWGWCGWCGVSWHRRMEHFRGVSGTGCLLYLLSVVQSVGTRCL